MKKIINELNSYKELEGDWDGYGGKAPLKEVVDSVINFLEKLNRISSPNPMLSGTGNVGCYWETDEYYIQIVFAKKDIYSFYVSKKEDDTYYGDDDLNVTNFRGSKLEKLIQKL